MYERNLEVDIRLITDYEYDVTITDTESGDDIQSLFTLDEDGEQDLRKFLGNEILSWVEMMLEQKAEEEGYEES